MTSILVVDNYDSFVYNLVQYLAQLGAEPVVRRAQQQRVQLAAVHGVLRPAVPGRDAARPVAPVPAPGAAEEPGAPAAGTDPKESW